MIYKYVPYRLFFLSCALIYSILNGQKLFSLFLVKLRGFWILSDLRNIHSSGLCGHMQFESGLYSCADLINSRCWLISFSIVDLHLGFL